MKLTIEDLKTICESLEREKREASSNLYKAKLKENIKNVVSTKVVVGMYEDELKKLNTLLDKIRFFSVEIK